MSTNQSTGNSASNAVKGETPGLNSACGVKFLTTDTIKIDGALGDMISNPIAMNLIRQDLRAWYLAYAPNWAESFSPNNLQQSTMHYELLDDFISGLIGEGILRMKGEKSNG